MFKLSIPYWVYINEHPIGRIDCFEKASLKGTVFAGGVTDQGDVKEHPAMQKAYEMGKSV